MNITPVLNSMAFGELTPKAMGLMGTSIYANACASLVNNIPLKTGGFRARPGTHYVYVDDITPKARLLSFHDAVGTSYILAASNLSVQPYSVSDHAIISAAMETEVTTAMLWELQHASSAGAMYMVHRSLNPKKIYSYSGSFSITEPAFTGDRTFDAADGRPGIVAFAGGRLFTGSTNNEPLSIFGSQIPVAPTWADAYLGFDFGDGSTADAIYLLENDMLARRLSWLTVQRLIIGSTDQGIWQSDGSIPTPISFDMNNVSAAGAAEIQPVKIGNTVVYVSKTLKSLRALTYSDDSGGYVDTELSIYSDHLFRAGITELAVSQNPEPLLVVTIADGTVVLGSVKMIESGIIAGFAKQELGGSGFVESCAVAAKASGDEIWFSVLRGATRTLEYLILDDIGGTALVDSFYIDCGLALTPESETVTGLEHLEGKAVVALGDGAVLPEKTVASGEVTYDDSVDKINIGYEYSSTYQSLRPEYESNGTAQNKAKRVEKIALRLYRSLGGAVGDDAEDLQSLMYDAETALYTGDLDMTIRGGTGPDGQFYITREDPLPLNVLAIFPRIAIMEV